MFFGKWGAAEWLSFFTGALLVTCALAFAPCAKAEPSQAPSGTASCADFSAEDQSPIKLPGTSGNDSCVVAFIENCTLEVHVVVNATTRSPVLGYKWVRRVDQRTVKSPKKTSKYASTTSDNYNYANRSSSVVHLNTYMQWPLPDCGKPKFDWIGVVSVTIRTKKRTSFGIGTHNAGQAADGAVVLH
jgi:hypothetical protein